MAFWSGYVVRPSQVARAMAAEGLEVWLCSYGGSGTNMLAEYLETKSLVVRTPIWHRLVCHHSKPINVASATKAIYLFGDPVAAFRSMKRRGRKFCEVNQQKLNNRVKLPFSDELLLRSMMRQFRKWTGENRTNLPILAVRFEHIFDEGKHAIADFLGIDVADFPERTSRRSDGYSFADDEALFARYAREIDRVRLFPPCVLRRPLDRPRQPRPTRLRPISWLCDWFGGRATQV